MSDLLRHRPYRLLSVPTRTVASVVGGSGHCEALICKIPLSEKLRALMNKKPLFTDKWFTKCIRPLSGKSTGIL